MRLLFLLVAGLMPAAALASGLDQLRHFLDTTKYAHGSFVQSVVGKTDGKVRQSTGLFAFSRPGKFRWSYEKPYRQLLVSDGQKLWSYDPDLNQVTVGKVGQLLGSSPAALLAGDPLDGSFALADAGAKDGIEFVEAVPKAKDGTFERVRIGFKQQLPVIMEIKDNFGQTSTLQLNQLEANVPMPADVFRFTPPKGADVIEQ